MARLIVCTVGTSIMGGKEKYEPADRFSIRIRERLKTARTDHGEKFYARASAEVNVLHKLGCGRDDEVLLLATDTEDGRACADLLQEFIESEFKARAKVETVTGLQMKDARIFRRDGVRALFQRLKQAKKEADERNLELVHNVTGGFKSVLPFSVLYGMMQGSPSYYAFEWTDSLIELPALPLTFDWERLRFAAEALLALRKQDVMSKREFEDLLPKHGYGDDAIYEILIERVDDMVAPSAAGDLLFESLEREIARSVVKASPAARRALQGSELAALAAEGLRNPLKRRIPSHQERMPDKTDMLIWKVAERPAPRLLYWVESGAVFLAHVFENHDDYDRVMLNGAGKWRREFNAAPFEAL